MRNTELQRSMGLTYDSSCASELAGWLAVRGCNGFMPREQLLPCALYHGDVPQGSECMQLTVGASNCARGLLCQPNEERTMQLCQEVASVLPAFARAGEACGGTTGAACDQLGAFCNPDGVCQDFPAAGETCDRGNCRLGAYCDRDIETCVASVARGDVCDDGIECGTRFCDEGVCISFCYAPPF